MKRTVFSLIIALSIVFSIIAAAPVEADASTYYHNGQTFTITAAEYLKMFQDLLEYNDCSYVLVLNEPFSDCNAQYYDMYDADQNYAMTLVLYTNYDTKKLETVRMYCTGESLDQLKLDGRYRAMLVAYLVANPTMTQEKWDRMITEETYSDHGYYESYYGSFDGVTYRLWIETDSPEAERTIEFSIV